MPGTDSRPNSPAPSIHDSDLFPSPPFDEQNLDADFILESAEGHRFRVAKAILIHNSPVFRTMLSLPLPTASERITDLQVVDGGLPVVQVTENSRTLDLLLRICYPIRSPEIKLEDLLVIEQVWQAGFKYDMDAVSFAMRKTLEAPHFREPSSALAVFIMACRNGWKEVAKRAARDTLKGPLLKRYNPALDTIKASVYHKLLQYHEDAQNKVVGLFERDQPSWFFGKMPLDIHTHLVCSSGRCSNAFHATCCTHHPITVLKNNWKPDFFDRARELGRKIPVADEMFTAGFLAPSISSGVCSACIESILKHWPVIASALMDQRELLLSEVEIDLSDVEF